MSVIFKKNIAVRKEVTDKMDTDINHIAVPLLETSIKNRTPVKTGNLKGSMTGRKTGWATGEVATNVPYAEHVEYGTSRMSPRAMMRLGAEDLEKRGVDIFKEE